MTRRFLIMAGIVAAVCLLGCSYEKTYWGKVIDEETNKPIEGAVVLAVWYTSMPTPGGSAARYYDAHETLTNKDGEFSIAGKGLNLGFRNPMSLKIMKAGYRYSGAIKRPEGEREIIQLKRYSAKKRRSMRQPTSPPDKASYERVKNYLRERDKDRIEQGLEPYGSWHGVHY